MEKVSIKDIHSAIQSIKNQNLQCSNCSSRDVTIRIQKNGWIGECQKCKHQLTSICNYPSEAANELISSCSKV